MARAQTLEVVGAYHSHPAGRPRPSATDRDEAHAGGFIYLIAGARRLRRSRVPPRVVGSSVVVAFTGTARRAAGARRGADIEAHGYWIAAWRLVEGNFGEVPLVRLT